MPHEGKRILQFSMDEESEQHQYAFNTAFHIGGSAISYQPLRMKTRVCLSYLSTWSDMLLLVCVTHTSQQIVDPSDQGLPLMRRSFDTRVSISVENSLSIGLVYI